jgi:FkbM family methyltransferase
MNRDIVTDPTRLRVVDVGASGGPQSRWHDLDCNLLEILFEPDPRESERLKERLGDRRIVLNSALSDHPGNLEFHMYRDQRASSVYKPDLNLLGRYYVDRDGADLVDDRYGNRRMLDIGKFDILKTVTIVADTLDNQLSAAGVMDVDFIKLDVQGHELPVLRGGRGALSNAIGVEVEVEFLPVYKGQPVFHQVDAFLMSCGFELYDLRRTFRNRCGQRIYGDRKGQLLWADALYMRSPEKLLREIDVTPQKIMRTASVFLAYHYPDLVSTLRDLAFSGMHINADEAMRLHKLVAKHEVQRTSVLPRFPGKQHLRAMFLKLADFLASGRRTDKQEDRTLGNVG